MSFPQSLSLSVRHIVSLCALFFFFQNSPIFAQEDSDQHHNIEGVTVHGGVNPADMLMDSVAQYRDRNGAFSTDAFQYTTYHKMAIYPTYLSDSLQKLDSQLLFLSESVSQVFYKSPNRHYEKMVASRTSGIQTSIFNLVFSRIQFQNLYAGDYLEVFQVEYVSPLAAGATRRYDFHIEDTLAQEGDTLIRVTYAPKSSMAFKSLRGTLWVHLGDYAVPHIQAVPVDKNVLVRVSVEQEYRKADNGRWFPDRLTARFPLPRIALRGDTLESYGRSTITVKDIVLDPQLHNSDFGVVDVEEVIASHKSSEKFLEQYRDSVLNDKEIRTYEVIDSIGRKLKLQRRLELLPSLSRGCLPVGPIDIDLTRIVDYSYIEGWRFGLGLYTNQRMARFCKLGGYFAYGLKDKTWKWGALTDWELYRKRDLILKLRIFNDIVESGTTQLVSRDEMGMLNGEYYRHWIITKYDLSRTLFAKLQMRPFKHLSVSVAGGYAWNHTLYDYAFLPDMGRYDIASYSYRNCYMRVGVRFAYQETTYRTRNFSLYEMSKYPTVQVLFEHGFRNVFGSGFDYNKINFRAHHLQRYKILGYSELSLIGGWLDRSLPYSLLYVMAAGYEKIGFYGQEQFAVMRPNEFVTDSYVAIFFRHNFGKMWEGKFSPRIVVCQNIGFGWLRHPEHHCGVGTNSIEKGYFESGLMIDNLLSVKDLMAMGIGVFYRYGPYALSSWKENMAVKVSLTVPMAE